MNHRKIDFFIKNLRGFWQYDCSTTWAKTCKQAKADYCTKYQVNPAMVKAKFAEVKA